MRAPGHDLTLIVESSVRALTEVWTGDTDPQSEVRAGSITVIGADSDARAFWKWLGRSVFAPTRVAALSNVAAR